MSYFLGIDIGGTWIIGTLIEEGSFTTLKKLGYQDILVNKVESPLNESATVEDLITSLKRLIGSFRLIDNKPEASYLIKAIGISTAGIVDYKGSRILKAAAHLSVLKSDKWKKDLEKFFNCPVTLINDADASLIGASYLNYLEGNKSIGILPVGTGLGFSVWRNYRRWRPCKVLTLLGSIKCFPGSYDTVSSATRLAALHSDKDLIRVLTQPDFNRERQQYIQNLSDIIKTAAILYNLDEIFVCGGLAEVSDICHFPLESKLDEFFLEAPLEMDKLPRVKVLKEGNKLQLLGTLLLAQGEGWARKNQVIKAYSSISTEIPFSPELQLQKLSSFELLEQLMAAEIKAAEDQKKSLYLLEAIIDKITDRLKKGGRLIYVGAGTSGRIAAMDAVEIPCTYGFPEDKVLCLVAGGISDAALEIESDHEEDASSIPEMCLLNLTSNDTVIGISASGSAYYVQSALAFAKELGIYSILIQSNETEQAMPFCDVVIPLYSGNEVVAGSTRMKAGTATKRVLNFISTVSMIKLGKVAGSYMIDVACINKKLVERAQNILKILYGIDNDNALIMLQNNNFSLSKVIKDLNENEN